MDWAFDTHTMDVGLWCRSSWPALADPRLNPKRRPEKRSCISFYVRPSHGARAWRLRSGTTTLWRTERVIPATLVIFSQYGVVVAGCWSLSSHRPRPGRQCRSPPREQTPILRGPYDGVLESLPGAIGADRPLPAHVASSSSHQRLGMALGRSSEPAAAAAVHASSGAHSYP